MKLINYIEKKEKYGIEGTGIDSITKKDRTWKDRVTKNVTLTIPQHSSVHVDFSPKKFPHLIFVTCGDEVRISRTDTAHQWLKGISKVPTITTLEKYQNNGISKSVTGKKVEPDGYSYDGSPSWELVLGLI